MGAAGANLAVEHQMHWTTTRFKAYPGSTQSFDGEDSYIDVFAGASHTALHLTGTLKGLPPGTGGIHIHQGCDEDDSKTIGGHFWESSSECSTNPWKSVQYTAVEGSAFELDVEVNAGVHWAETLGRTVVIHSPDGSRLAVASLRPASDIPVSADASLRLPPFLSFELYEPAVCQEDYAPAKACAASSIADSCAGPSAAGSACGHVARNHRWWVQQLHSGACKNELRAVRAAHGGRAAAPPSAITGAPTAAMTAASALGVLGGAGMPGHHGKIMLLNTFE